MFQNPLTTRWGRARVFGLMALPILLASTPRTSEDSGEQSREAEITAIETTLNNYLFGSMEGDVERLRSAFHPSAEIEGVRDGQFTSWTAPDYVGGTTPGRVRDFVPRILAVDFTGNAAQGKVECDYGTWKFVDYMQLLKIDGEWKIINKIYFRVVK